MYARACNSQHLITSTYLYTHVPIVLHAVLDSDLQCITPIRCDDWAWNLTVDCIHHPFVTIWAHGSVDDFERVLKADEHIALHHR